MAGGPEVGEEAGGQLFPGSAPIPASASDLAKVRGGARRSRRAWGGGGSPLTGAALGCSVSSQLGRAENGLCPCESFHDSWDAGLQGPSALLPSCPLASSGTPSSGTPSRGPPVPSPGGTARKVCCVHPVTTPFEMEHLSPAGQEKTCFCIRNGEPFSYRGPLGDYSIVRVVSSALRPWQGRPGGLAGLPRPSGPVVAHRFTSCSWDVLSS